MSFCTHPPRQWHRGVMLLPCADPECSDKYPGDYLRIVDRPVLASYAAQVELANTALAFPKTQYVREYTEDEWTHQRRYYWVQT